MTTAAETRRSPLEQPAAYTRPGLTLRGAARLFAGCLNAWVIGAATVAVTAARLAVAGWTWWDLLAGAAVLACQPFTEWFIHVLVLHMRPRSVLGVTVDPLLARRHRAHHRRPAVVRDVLIPRSPLVVTVIVLAPALFAVVPDHAVGLTAAMVAYWMLLVYEWTHFLIHSTYRPRSWYYRYIWRAHRLHHFRNERYWFGVTVHVADHALRTFPAKQQVPVSATAATLGS